MNQEHKLSMRSIRLESLGDSIFAVAMTLLAIELSLPVVKESTWRGFATAFHDKSTDFLCFFISFIVLGIMWFAHRMIFEYIGKTNRYFIFLGVLFYTVICLVPFSTRFLAHYIFEWFAILVYGLNLSLCNLTLYLQWRYALKRHSLLERVVPPEVKKKPTGYFFVITCRLRFCHCFFVICANC